MDFSAFNPNSSNSLNMAARNNDTGRLKRLLRKNNPNCVDNRGWTCLHEAAANDHYDCMKIILKHPDCRPLAETFEGHTALYLAIRNKSSVRCIKLLLDSVENIAQYASNEMVSPLHIACLNENISVVELLIQYDSIIDLQDFDGDTPLHEAATKNNPEIISLLLHAGAEPEKRNQTGLTPFHMACAQGYIGNVEKLLPFITNIDDMSNNREASPLMLASQLGHEDIVKYLLTNGANPNLTDNEGNTALMYALMDVHADIFKILLTVTDHEAIAPDIFIKSCQPIFFNTNILVALLESDLEDEFFNCSDVLSENMERVVGATHISPLHSFFLVAEYIYTQSSELFVKLLHLLLMRGVSVNPLTPHECPPLVYFHLCDFAHSFDEVLKIMISHGCNIDYISTPTDSVPVIPDIIQISLTKESKTLIPLLEYSLMCEPETIIEYARNKFSTQSIIYQCLKEKLCQLADERQCLAHLRSVLESAGSIPTLQHIGRHKIRHQLRLSGINSTRLYLQTLTRLQLPRTLVSFLSYKI